MKNKFIKLLGLTPLTLAPIAIAASCNTTSENSEDKKVLEEKEIAGTNIKIVPYKGTVEEKALPEGWTYSTETNLSSINKEEFAFEPASGQSFANDKLISTKGKENSYDIFLSSFQGTNTVYGKSESTKPFEGINLGTFKGTTFNFTTATNPIYTNSKGLQNASGYATVIENTEGRTIKVLVRLFNFKSKQISKSVYELTLTHVTV
ncbi:Uncharacterised protein [Mycoplasmopsis maculosa]|uniref:Lipoprotein n=1 Tax=Mycoplasmopsis maculosa TaxID=114885 RepID=A0A449B3L1_9BACT|nr:variable surface lipoprotein [Mycoplasmopsis maculosa]VEU75177.1 Uncharacterised protein [Mycoplasmopsis maculosa]